MTASAQAPTTITPVAAVIEGRRARPAPNLIYHINDKGGADAAPQASGRTESLTQPAGSSLPPPSQDTTQNTPPVSPPLTSPPQALPAQGWRTAGSPAQSMAAETSQATTSQVARPPTMEPSRQVILEWQQPK